MREYEYDKAIVLIDRFDKENLSQELTELKARALKGLNLYKAAILEYEKSYEKDTTQLRNLIEMASCYRSLGNNKKAQDLYLKALSRSSNNNFLYLQLGDVFYQDDQLDSAIKYYDHTYQVDSSFYLARQLGRCFDKLNQADSAIYYYKKAIARNPIDFQSNYLLSDIYKQREEYDLAIEGVQTYLDYDSSNLKMLKLEGYLCFLMKRYTCSIASFEKCLTLNDTSDFTQKFLGLSYYKVEEYQRAKKYLEAAFQNDTTNLSLCYALGISYDGSGESLAGVRYFHKTILLATPTPGFLSMVYQNMAKANIGCSQYKSALTAYKKALQLTPDDTLLLFKLGIHYDHNLNETEKALFYYQKFIKTRSEDDTTTTTISGAGVMADHYYDYAEQRISEIKEELFLRGKDLADSAK